MEQFWTAEKMEQLRAFAAAGMSGGQMGDALGCSRNAIIGKAHRSGIALKNRRNDRTAEERLSNKRVRIRKLRVASPSIPFPEKIVPLNLSFPELNEFHCRWPYGEGPYTFCGHWPLVNSAYCPFHQAKSKMTYEEKRSEIANWRIKNRKRAAA